MLLPLDMPDRDAAILLRNGEAVQALSRVRVVAMDKTGTVTVGKPAVVGVQARGLFSAQTGLDVGGFFTVDLVRAKLNSQLALALFTGVEEAVREMKARMKG